MKSFKPEVDSLTLITSTSRIMAVTCRKLSSFFMDKRGRSSRLRWMAVVMLLFGVQLIFSPVVDAISPAARRPLGIFDLISNTFSSKSSGANIVVTVAPTSAASKSAPGSSGSLPVDGNSSKRAPLSTGDDSPVDKSFHRQPALHSSENRTKSSMQTLEDPFSMPFGYTVFGLILISFVVGRKLYDTWRQRALWTNPIVPARMPRMSRVQQMQVLRTSSEKTLTEPTRKGGEVEDDEDSTAMVPVFEDGAVSQLLPNDVVSRLVTVLPARFGTKDWRLLYATAEHGISLNQFYRKTRHQGATLTVIQDANNYVFAVFVAESWHKSGAHFGNGETMVMSISPKFQVYRWTEANNYFAIGKADFIAVGGGSNFALWLDESFLHGSSKPCETFGSPALASSPEFSVCSVEVWGFT